jgi:methylated-DNA-protein-cysteine methyltransferase related protein
VSTRPRVPAIAAVLPRSRPPGRWERVYAVVRRVPRGRVATYGQVAALAGLGRNARLAGYALHALHHDTPVPWHRVINARGAISLPPMGGADLTQRIRLEKEGVRFDARGRVDLERYGWRGRAPSASASSPPRRAAASPRSAAAPAGGRGRRRR